MDYYIAPVDKETDFLKISSPEELKIVDPACGSGHMLTYAFDLLHAIYEEAGSAPADIPTLILTHNLHGTEIDTRAGSLAAFALTMKARAKQRTFFNKQITPNICVITPISFNPTELDFLVTKNGDRHAEEEFWNQFTHADTLGSLIQPNPQLTQDLPTHLQTLHTNTDLLTEDIIKRATQVIHQATYLLPRYTTVIANPPYMGSANMNAELSEFAKLRFSDAKSDLMTMFIERAEQLVLLGGNAGLVTRDSWMFLSRFTDFRLGLVGRVAIHSLVHFGSGAFDGNVTRRALVQAVGFCFSPNSRPSNISRGAYLRLTECMCNLQDNLLD
jgi:type II restriction/modification system DNA methylase subunit YeeA